MYEMGGWSEKARTVEIVVVRMYRGRSLFSLIEMNEI